MGYIRKIFQESVLVAMYFALLFAGVGGCSGDGEVEAEILTYDAVSDSYQFQVVTIETLNDLNTLSGSATHLMGGTSMELDFVQGWIRWEKVGRPVAFGAARSGGVYYPEDFNSLAMISVYYNIEQAMLFFESIGLASGALGPIDTYYRVDILEVSIDPLTGDITEELGTDNAFFLAIADDDKGFYVLPFEETERLPFSMNLGIMTHEYSHAVFDYLVYDELPRGRSAVESTVHNYLLSLNEGIADIMAVTLTGDPDYIIHSVSNPYIIRNAADVIVYSAHYDVAAQILEGQLFNPYMIGAFLSSAVYEIARRSEGMADDGPGIPSRQAMQNTAAATLRALESLGATVPANFDFPDYLNLFIDELDQETRSHACNVLYERYTIHYSEIVGCQ